MMMQSVALLSDSQCPTEMEREYVIVPYDNNANNDEDASYDYCDDVFSIDAPMEDETSVLSACLEDPLTVNEGTINEGTVDCSAESIMVYLDEAHEAARLAIGEGDREEEGEGTKVVSSPECGGDNSSHSSANDENEDTPVVSDDDEERVTMAEKTVENEPVEANDGQMGDQPITLSRVSNKKRRKKMKLMKKAAAAAAAATALSEGTVLSSGTRAAKAKVAPNVKKSPKKSAGRCHSKRVANIAVACATESISAYKQDVLNGKKNRKVW